MKLLAYLLLANGISAATIRDVAQTTVVPLNANKTLETNPLAPASSSSLVQDYNMDNYDEEKADQYEKV